MIADPLLWLLQANDSSYPSGAYAHSFGLKELAEAGIVRDAAGLEAFLECQLLPALLTLKSRFSPAPMPRRWLWIRKVC